MEKVVEVWSPRTEEFKARMDKMVRKAAKLGCGGSLGYERLGRVVRKVTHEGGVEKDCSFTQFRVWGEPPKIEGWKFVASLHHVRGEGTLVHGLDDVEFPERYRTSDKPLCEHCNTRRPRKDTYLVMNEDSGEFKQVGSTCLRDFLGHDSPSKIAAMCGLLMETGELDEAFGFLPGSGSYYREYALAAVLALTVMFIRREGRYISKSEAKASEEDAAYTGRPVVTATSQMVADSFEECDRLRAHLSLHLGDDERTSQKLAALTPTDEDEAAAEAARSWVANEMEAKSNFDHNLKTAADFALTDPRSLGVACYIIPAHQRHLAALAAAKLREQFGESEHVGTIKKREVFTLTVTKKFEVEGYYGTSTVHKFTDPQGNSLVWFSSRDTDLEVGHTYEIKATVKEHREYKGQKETAINRAVCLGERGEAGEQLQLSA